MKVPELVMRLDASITSTFEEFEAKRASYEGKAIAESILSGDSLSVTIIWPKASQFIALRVASNVSSGVRRVFERHRHG